MPVCNHFATHGIFMQGLKGVLKCWAVNWRGAKRMGGGKRTRERALPKIFGPLQKSFWSALSWIFVQEKQSTDTWGGGENVPYDRGSKTPFWEGIREVFHPPRFSTPPWRPLRSSREDSFDAIKLKRFFWCNQTQKILRAEGLSLSVLKTLSLLWWTRNACKPRAMAQMPAEPRKMVSAQADRDSKSQCDSKFTPRSQFIMPNILVRGGGGT